MHFKNVLFSSLWTQAGHFYHSGVFTDKKEIPSCGRLCGQQPPALEKKNKQKIMMKNLHGTPVVQEAAF